jgi:hypothetical protein
MTYGMTMIARMTLARAWTGRRSGPGRTGEESQERCARNGKSVFPEHRDQHEDAPQSVHHARDRGQQADEEGHRLAHELGCEIREVDGPRRGTTGTAISQGEQGRQAGFRILSRKRAELFGHRVPDAGSKKSSPNLDMQGASLPKLESRVNPAEWGNEATAAIVKDQLKTWTRP